MHQTQNKNKETNKKNPSHDSLLASHCLIAIACEEKSDLKATHS